MSYSHTVVLLLLLYNFLAFEFTSAYVGPGIALISYLFGPIVAVVVVIAMVLYLPVKLILKKRKKKKDQSVAEKDVVT